MTLTRKRLVKISAASARLRFIECGPTCISKKDCTARCCDMVTHPQGMKVTIHETEQERIEKLGGKVIEGFLQPKPGTKGCPFKQDNYLCSLHDSGNKPFGCVVSPFMLNRSSTLVIRNRYKLLPCYNPGNGDFAYRVFNSSLYSIFGIKEAKRIIRSLDDLEQDDPGKDLYAWIPNNIYKMLNNREQTLKASKGDG